MAVAFAAARPVWAQQPAQPAGAAAIDEPVVVLVAPGDSGIDPSAVARAISRELGTTVTNRASDRSRATVDVRANRGRVSVTYADRGGRELTRTVVLPDDPAQKVEVIAWVAGNLARDEAGELIAGIQAESRPDAPATPEVTERDRKAAPPNTEKPRAARDVDQGSPAPESPGLAPSTARARPLELPARIANLSFYHPLSIYPDSHRRKINFEVGFVYSRIGALSGVGLTLGHLRVDGDARGAVIGPLWTRVDGRSSGVFTTVVYSDAAGDLTGFELTGIASIRRGSLTGVKVSGIVNRTGPSEGGELAGIVNDATGEVRGAQIAGITNIARGSLAGVQVAGIANLAADVEGGQLSMAFNRALRLEGAQLGVANLASRTDGAQLGIVNLSGRVRGVQLGLVNVADRVDGLSLAPVSVIREGRTELVLFGDTTIIANAGVRYSTGFLYSMFGVGWDPLPELDRALAIGAGIGGHVARFEPGFLDVDVFYRYVMPDYAQNESTDRHSTAYRVVLGAHAWDRLSVFATGGVEHLYDDTHRVLGYGGAGLTLRLSGKPAETAKISNRRRRLERRRPFGAQSL